MRYLKGSIVLSLIFLISGCSLLGNEESEQPTALTQQLRSAAQQVPTYGGVTVDQDQITIHLLGSDKKETANSAVQEIFGESADEVTLNVRPATGEATESLKSKAAGVTTVEGVHTLDYDETIDYLRVRVDAASAVVPVQEKLKELEVPLDQVIITVDGGIETL